MNTSENAHPLFVIAVLTFIAVVAGIIVYQTMEDSRLQQFAHESFVPVQAKVLESEVRSRTRDGKRSYHPHIYYRFEVEGKGYRSKRYSFININNTKSSVEAAVANHPVGAVVTAYYNPDNPKKAVLDNSEPDLTRFYIFIAAFGAVYLFIVGVVFRQYVRESTPSDEELLQ